MVTFSRTTLLRSYASNLQGSILLLHSNSYENPQYENDNQFWKTSLIQTLVIKDANNRGFDINRLTCMDNSTNLFRKIIDDTELINQDTYTLVCYRFEKYDQANGEHDPCCRLTDISHNHSDYIALPINTETLIGAITKVKRLSLGGEVVSPEEYDEVIPLLDMYLDLCRRIVPKTNNLGDLKDFVTRMCACIKQDLRQNTWKKYWGPQSLFVDGGNLDSVFTPCNDMDAITFYRRFICENWAMWTGVAGTFTDGQHRQSSLEHATCYVDLYNSLHQGPLVNDDDDEGRIRAMMDFALNTPHSDWNLEFNIRIPLLLDEEIIAELNTESREIQERRDQARAVGLFGELNNVVIALVDMSYKNEILFFCNDESKDFINGHAGNGDSAELVRVLNEGKEFEYLEKSVRCNTYCDLWTRHMIRNLVTLLKKHKTYDHTPYRRVTQSANIARFSHYQKTVEQLYEEMVKAFLSVMAEGRTQVEIPPLEPTVLGRTVHSTIASYYYLLHGSENIESRYGAINQFFATDIDLVQILMWACYDENNLLQLKKYLKNPSSLTPQEITYKDNTKLQLDALIALCIFVSSSVYHARDALKLGNISVDDMSRAMRAHLIACAAFKDGLQFIKDMGLNPSTELTKSLRQTLEFARMDGALIKHACEKLGFNDYFNSDGDGGKTILHSVSNYWHPQSESSLLILAQFHGVQLILDDEKKNMAEDTIKSLVNCLDEFNILPSEPMEFILPVGFLFFVDLNNDFQNFALELLMNVIKKGVHKLQKNSKNKKSSKNKDQKIVDLMHEFMMEAKKLEKSKAKISEAAATYSGRNRVDSDYVEQVFIDRITENCKQFDKADDFIDRYLNTFSESERVLAKEHCISGFVQLPCDQDLDCIDASELVGTYIHAEATEAAGGEEEIERAEASEEVENDGNEYSGEEEMDEDGDKMID